MKKHHFAYLSAGLNFLGAIFLFLSFQATSTDFILVTATDGRSALCVGKNALFFMTPDGGLGMGTKCPDWETGKPTAVVNTEHPSFAKAGIFFILFGFLLQLFSIDKPKDAKKKPTQPVASPDRPKAGGR